MDLRQTILKCSSVLLLLILLQKSGTGLLIHHFKHRKSETIKESGAPREKNNTVGFACGCIDQFLTPFANAEIVLSIGPLVNVPVQNACSGRNIQFRGSIETLLRGPPVSLA